MDLFLGLNKQQKKAVETVEGRVLVLAGAGSGKTRVLTLRMAYLITQLGKSPKSILGLTFTNKAAAEMRHRLAALIGVKLAKQVTLCTFHSFCMHLLRSEIHHLGYTSQFTLCDENDVQRIISTIARDLLECEGSLPSLGPTIEAITLAKQKGLKSQKIAKTGSEWHDQFTQNVYQRLEDSLRAYNAVDFDSLINLTVQLFQKFSAILEKYQDQYRYIMIDEYQDTNPIQCLLAELLSDKYGNLCVVGDDDQSIYGWRGADIQNILDFKQAATIKLEQNYRSTNTILQSANAVIQHNQKRHSKSLWSQNGVGIPIEIFHAPNEEGEAQAVVYRIDKLREKEGLKWGDIAILYRSNSLARSFETALLKYTWKQGETWIRGIPYQVCGGTEFYERKEVKDLFAYLRVIVNPLDQEALLRIINYPRRGIGDAALDKLTAYNRKNKIPLWEVLKKITSSCIQDEELLKLEISKKSTEGIHHFLNLMEKAVEKFSQPNMSEALKWLVETINYRKAIYEEVKSTQMRDFKWENVQEFILTLADYEQRNSNEKIPSLHDYVTTSPLDRGWNGALASDLKEDHVLLMTFHSSKGLEFPACFLVGMEDHIIPHEKSMAQTGLEEERRLMYVALTRAKTCLTISMAQKRKKMGVDSASKPSRFLFDIPKELTKISQWDKIE